MGRAPGDCDDQDVEAKALFEAEEALCPGLHHPVRQRLLELMASYQPLARQHILDEYPHLAGEKNKYK